MCALAANGLLRQSMVQRDLGGCRSKAVHRLPAASEIGSGLGGATGHHQRRHCGDGHFRDKRLIHTGFTLTYEKAVPSIGPLVGYVYQASPMDGTLKAMLERWAKDSGRTLDYRLSSDFTLYGAVSNIDTTNAQQAVIDLTAAYAAQGISVSIVGNQIVVQSAGSTPTASAQGADSNSGT